MSKLEFSQYDFSFDGITINGMPATIWISHNGEGKRSDYKCRCGVKLIEEWKEKK